MANPFDQFDAPVKAADNPFDQFDPKQPTGAGAQPSWGDVASQAVQNLPSSAYGIAQGIGNMVMHPIDTAGNLYNVGKGAVSKAEGAVGVTQDPAQKASDEAGINAVRDFFVNRYGSMDQFKQTLAKDPAGVAMDLSTVFTGPEMALSRLPGAVGRAGELSGDIARATNPVSLAGRAVANVADRAAAPILGMTTGAGATPIRQAAAAGAAGSQTFLDNMRGSAPMSDTVDMAQNALSGMRKDRSAAYQSNMQTLNSDPTWLNYQPIDAAISDADKMVNFKGLSTSDDASNVVDAIRKKVSDWRSIPTETSVGPDGKMAITGSPYTIEAVDKLKQAIGEIRQGTQPGTLSRKVADNVYNAAKSSIVEQAPAYADAMKDYSNASDQINELNKTFSLGEKASQDTALRKLQSVMRNNVNTNYGQRAKLMDELAQYQPDLPNALAGQALNSATPRGLSRLGAIELGGGAGIATAGHFINPATLAAMPLFSPRVVGEGAYAAGRVGNALAPAANALAHAAKAAYVMNALAQPGLRGGIGPRYDDNGNLR